MADLLLVVAIAVPVLIGVAIVVAVASSQRKVGGSVAVDREQSVGGWLVASGWQAGPTEGAQFPPALRAEAAVPQRCALNASGTVDGVPVTVQLWSAQYRRKTNPWRHSLFLSLVMAGAPAQVPHAALADANQSPWVLMHLTPPLAQTRMQRKLGLLTWNVDDGLAARLAPFAGALAGTGAWLILNQGLVAVAGHDQPTPSELESRTRLAAAVARALN
ncbi:hypothetical protein [Occultella gossypii]|uniref:Uncharacterized protein n=1 Tax=Occultella gossypii TaxID=2800820 RepID=A0ABS7S825_9MICO|nr:hypothetical protein [Occultella gossypii]MBZ2196504.1 hypothetical protein [Occultella gossypii]